MRTLAMRLRAQTARDKVNGAWGVLAARWENRAVSRQRGGRNSFVNPVFCCRMIPVLGAVDSELEDDK